MKSYLKFLSRNKLYTAIQAVGLVVSLAFVILIGGYARHQWRTAHGAPEWKHYWAVGTSYDEVDFVQRGLANLLKENLPGVDMATTFCYYSYGPTIDGEPLRNEGIAYVESDFFNMFPIEWIEGDVSSLIGNGIAISERIAREHFQGREALGQPMIERSDTVIVAAVFRTVGVDLFDKTDFIRLREYKELQSGAQGGTACLISSRLPEDELITSLDRVLEEHCRKRFGRDESRALVNGCIERLDRLYFSDLNGQMAFHKGNLSLLRMLSAVVLLLLLSAVFNFINLSAALAGKRTKEMGMRAILGATRRQVVLKYLAESLLFTVVCAGIAVLVAHAFAPTLSGFVETRRGVRFVSAPFSWSWDATSAALYIGLTLIVGLLAGWIPARLASRFNPIQVVKGDYRIRSKRVFSKVFIVFQTALAVLLVAFSLVMERQYAHMIHRPVGANIENMYVQSFVSDAQVDAVRQLPFVAEFGRCQGYPGGSYMTVSGAGKDGESRISFTMFALDPDAFRMCGYEVVEDFHTPSGTGAWLSETAWRAIDLEPGQTELPDWCASLLGTKQLAGVLRDFATSDAAHIDPDGLGVINVMDGRDLLLRIKGDMKAAAKQLEDLYRQFCIERYGSERISRSNGFVEDNLKGGLEEAENYMRLIELFMLLALLVALLGLLAMSALYASEQTHDVAVRKVFGGTVGGEVMHGARNYMILVGIACVIALPVAVWIARRYLQDFYYRIEGYGWIFAVAVVIAVLISFASVLWQTLRAARTNPAVELKKE